VSCLNALFSELPALDSETGVLTFTTKANESCPGSLVYELQLKVIGRAANSSVSRELLSVKETVTVEVREVNDRPTFGFFQWSNAGDAKFVAGPGLVVFAHVPQYNDVFLTDVSVGPEQESTQNKSIVMHIPQPNFFSVLPTIEVANDNYILTYFLAEPYSPTSFQFQLCDDGGGDTACSQEVTVSITFPESDKSYILPVVLALLGLALCVLCSLAAFFYYWFKYKPKNKDNVYADSAALVDTDLVKPEDFPEGPEYHNFTAVRPTPQLDQPFNFIRSVTMLLLLLLLMMLMI